ncbi:gamma-glutamylcyclotransferase [Pseudoalteromonas xiamenensis]|uniref:gamma-glutamylcyclotransferase family protein n=1 Tax=Pseudoalteromonas xiamenensis TaxID=882626 RepID=UPI0027E4BE53|nr:gamma-glutamylcyclotransferase family protein [Pseudoalteromonas xiamenensis]WMN61114.1 gamma-glutamylcyclotransferase [Pseudoalteromonas xiamenensis]
MEKRYLNFAFGSNMARARLFSRLPDAKRVSTAKLDNWKLTFRMLAVDGSTKCDIERSSGDRVFGVVYALSESEKRQLDAIEGDRYECVEVCVSTQDGQHLNAFAYVANTHNDKLKPYSWYLNHVVQGAYEAQVPDSYMAMLKQTPVQEDQDELRAKKEWSVYEMNEQGK